MSTPMPSRPASEARLEGVARSLTSRLHAAERRRDIAQGIIDDALDELTRIHAAACKKFRRPVPPDALLLDILELVDVTDDDVWLWRGMRNNHGTPTVKFVESRRNHERSLARYLAIAFGVIAETDNGTLYPNGDADDVNPWHRTLRATPESTGNRFRFSPKAPE
jgi:hypothetical protein